jgi:Family of unknown function (DUF6188)
MYKLPTDLELSFVTGAQLLQVCVGQNEVIVNFDRNIRITILSEIEVSVAAPAESNTRSARIAALLDLLGAQVVHAAITAAGALVVRFESGTTLEVLEDNECYESFWIQHGERLFAA